MTAPRAVLHDVAKYGLNPKKKHSSIKATGHLAYENDKKREVVSPKITEVKCDVEEKKKETIVSPDFPVYTNETLDWTTLATETIVVADESESLVSTNFESVEHVDPILDVPVVVEEKQQEEVQVIEPAPVEFVEEEKKTSKSRRYRKNQSE